MRVNRQTEKISLWLRTIKKITHTTKHMYKVEWTEVSEKLPEHSGDYLVSDGNAIMVVSYCAKKHMWNKMCSNEEQSLIDFWTSDDINYWAHLPSLPAFSELVS